MDFRRSIATTSARVALIAALWAPRAHAQPGDADALFARGKKLMEQDKIEDACESFEASNRLDPRAGTLIWIGECRARNHQYASAWTAYKDALARVKDPRKKAIATSKLAAVEDRLSYLLVVVGDDRRIAGLTITRDGQPLAADAWNRGLPIDGGEYAITASAPGRTTWTTTVIVPPELGRIRVEVPVLDSDEPVAPPTAPPAPPIGPPASPQQPTAPPVDTAHDAGRPSAWTPRRKLALGLTAGSAATGAIGIVLGLEAGSRQHDALALCPSAMPSCLDARRANQLLDEGAHRALAANLAFGAAAALAIGAGALWFTAAPDRGIALVPSISPGAAGVALVGPL